MKNYFNYAASAVLSILVLASCSKENLVDNSNGRKLHFVVKTAESAPVKSYITSDGNGSYTPIWHKSDEIAIFTANITANTPVSGNLSNTNEDGATASFDGVVSATTSGVFKAIYPAGRVTNGLAPEGDAECVGVNLGDPDNGFVQKPVLGSFDPLCDILVSKPTAYTSDGETVTSNDVYFKRVMSVVKVVLKGSAAANQAVSTFTMTSEGATLSGRAKINVTNARVESWTVKNSFVKAAFAENNEPIINNDNKNAFFLEVNPVTLPKDSKLTITAETATHYINKEITLPRDIVFPEGQMAVLNITINEDNLTAKSADNPKYLLVKDVAEITIGSEIIIVAAGSNYALGTTQGDKNRNAVSITKSSDKASIENIGSDVQVFTVQAGTKENTVAFYTGKGYIYAASSSDNHLKTQNSIDDNASWSISISTEGIAKITAQGKNTRNVLKKNSNSALFSCYSSGQSDVAIYINSKKALGTPQNLKTSVTDNVVTVSWDAVDNAYSYDVTCAGQKKNVTTTEATFGNVAVGTYEVSVVAVSNNQSSFKNSSAAVTSVIVGKPTLDKPVIKTVNETANGFYAELESAVQYAESYSWVLYEGSVADGIFVGNGTNTTEKFSITINETDFLITAFKPETTYNLVITAEAAAYTSSESDPASFKTAASSGGESIVTGFNAKWTGFTTTDNNGQTSISASSENTSATITSKNGNNNKINCAAAGLYSKKMSENDYWLITIPNVTNTVESTTVTVTFGGIKVNKAANKVVYKFQYSIDGTTYNDFGEEYTETTTSVSKTITFMPGVIKENSTLYIRVFVKSGGSTSAGSHYIGTTLTVSAN